MSLTLICRTATIFHADGRIDEDGFRQHLQRLIDHDHGLYLASGGSGEGHVLTHAELRQVYAAGVACGRGKVPVYANPPEQHTAQLTLEHSLLAIEAGVELVNVYGPSALHGYTPSDEEFEAYHDALLPQLRHPVALAPNPILGYAPDPRTVARLCNRYPQVEAINLALQTDDYMLRIQADLNRPVHFYAPISGSLNALALGAHGLLGAEANILPETHARYVSRCGEGATAALGLEYRRIKRFTQLVGRHGTSPRWLKMALRVLGLPGGEGRPRPPYLMPGEAVLRRFAADLAALDIPELEGPLSSSRYLN
jgi:dihydrodipicolinate synthase/N-acetylneuraminate lyase